MWSMFFEKERFLILRQGANRKDGYFGTLRQ